MNITRRDLLASTAAVAAVAVVAGGTTAAIAAHAAVTPIDPVLALATEHEALEAELARLDNEEDRLYDAIPKELRGSITVNAEQGLPAHTEADLAEWLSSPNHGPFSISPTRQANYDRLLTELREKQEARRTDPRFDAYRKVELDADAIVAALGVLESKVARTRATTLAGARAKARVLARHLWPKTIDEALDEHAFQVALTLSLAADLERLTGRMAS